MPEYDFKKLREILDWLINKFRFERLIYLIATCLSIIMLLTSGALMLFRQGNLKADALLLLFSSTGIIGYTVNRVMRMFDQVLNVISAAKEKGEKDE